MPRRKKDSGLSDPDVTVLEGGDAEPGEVEEPKKRKKRGRPRKSELHTPEEVAEKLHILLSLFSTFAGREYRYTAEDYAVEARGLVRLSDKFPIVHVILSLFDPLLVIGGIVNKFLSMPKRAKPEAAKKEEKPVEPVPANVVTMKTPGGVPM